MPGIDQIPFLTNTSMMELDTAPPHLVIVGGSYVGLEFGQMFRRFGSEVTIVEMAPRLVQREDPEISSAIQDLLTSEGIDLRLNARCIRLSGRAGAVVAHVDCQDGSPAVEGTHLLLAVGRQPNTDDLGLDAAGVSRDERGYIVVNDRLETSVPGIWALGDCNGKGAFTHTAYNDFEIVAANLLDGEARGVSERIQAYALYTDPPLGRVGMTETEAQRSGRSILVGKRPMTRVGRAIEKGETTGADEDRRRRELPRDSWRGGVRHRRRRSDPLRAGYDVRESSLPVLQRAMHIHPTVAELIPTILQELAPPAS